MDRSVVFAACAAATVSLVVGCSSATVPQQPDPPIPPDSTSTSSSGAADDRTSITVAERSTTSSTIPPPEPAPGTTVCDAYSSIDVIGSIESDDLIEVSGLTAGGKDGMLAWAHNDSRSGALLHAIGSGGSDLGSTEVRGVFAFDWEDMAAGPGPSDGTRYLYVADIGDNFGIRRGQIAIHRMVEPSPGAPDVAADTLDLAYAGGEPLNAEAVFVDPVDAEIYIVSRDRDSARVFRADALAEAGSQQILEEVATLELGAEVTGSDITADGSIIALRGERDVWMWHRATGATIAETLGERFCRAPAPDERQGESIAFLLNGAYLTTSEGSHPPLHLVNREGGGENAGPG